MTSMHIDLNQKAKKRPHTPGKREKGDITYSLTLVLYIIIILA